MPGTPITFTLHYSTNGPAFDVTITDILPAGLSDPGFTSSGAVITDSGQVPGYVWQVADLAPGEGGVITITAVAQAERFLNTASISSSSPDPNLDNNTASVQTHMEGVIFVDRDARGTNDGSSWVNAYTDLQDALGEAISGDQVWVAEGIYNPTNSITRTLSFELTAGVAIHGGFAGTEKWLYERDRQAHTTILSGDIGTLNNLADNAYHVVASSGVTETAVLEGFIITAGNANGQGADGMGGGLYNDGSPTLLNLTFIGNRAKNGGALYNASGNPTLFNIAFSGNTASSNGGGLYNASGSPQLVNTTFSRNAAGLGGGIYNDSGSPLLENSILWGNTPGQIGSPAGVTINNSDIQGGCPAGAACTDVIGADPQFIDSDGLDDMPGTLDDDLRLHTTYSHPNPVIDRGDNAVLPADLFDLDGDGDMIEAVPFDLSDRWRVIGFNTITTTVDLGAFEATIEDVLAQGEALFADGESFRLENLQLLSSDTLAEALQNYANFNDGEWYYAFCADYDQIDANDYCPPTGPGEQTILRDNVRNTLLDAVDLYRVAVGYPSEVFTPTRSAPLTVRLLGGRGVLDSAVEIANVHLIFGNEFLVDATDYRFSTGGIPYADEIIAMELDELGQAQLQFELIMELVFRAYNDWGVANYSTSDQFEQFGAASSLLMTALNETAARYYMLRQSDMALQVFNLAYTTQYLQIIALAELATDTGAEYLLNGSWEMLNNLSQMRAHAQAIHDGLDFFGFSPEYVPLQPYDQLLQLTEGPTGNTGLLGTASSLEDQARDAQRTFDANASAMATELDNLTVELENQLFELCGESQDDYATCEGGLMEQNFNALDAAALRVGLAYLRAQNIVEQIRIEQERARSGDQRSSGCGQGRFCSRAGNWQAAGR